MSIKITDTHRKFTKDGKVQVFNKGRVAKSAPSILSVKGFFAVEAGLLYNVLPQINCLGGLSNNAARLYLLMLCRTTLKKNHTWVGHVDARENLGFSQQDYNDASAEMDMKHFTIPSPCINAGRHRYCRDIMSLPFYQASTGAFFSNTEPRTTPFSRSATKFVVIPNPLVTDGWLNIKDGGLSLRALKVLLKLYEHNNLVQYGGINPHMLECLHGGLKYSICPTLYEDIGLTEDLFIRTLDALIDKGLLRISHIIVDKYDLMQAKMIVYQCEDDKYCIGSYQLKANTKTMTVLRPRYLPLLQVDKWVHYLGQQGADIHAIQRKLLA